MVSVGKPVIAWRIADISEQIENERTGILVSAGHVRELKYALSRLQADRDLRNSMVESSLKRYQSHFSLEETISKYSTFYKSIF